MKRADRYTLIGLAFVACCWSVPAHAQNGGGQREDEGFEAFSRIVANNIFDPDRRPAPPEGPPPGPTPTPRPPTESILLAGTFLTDSRQVAILTSQESDLNGPKRVGDELRGWAIESIETSGVGLVRDESRIDWRVGTRIERVGEGEWRISGEAVPTVSRGPNGSSSSSAGSSSSEPTSDLIERMRQRRLQETGNE